MCVIGNPLSDEISEAKARVLDAAENLFRDRGFNSVTMQDIAEALGMRQASLYYHVPQGKEELFAEVHERLLHRHKEGLVAAIESGSSLEGQLNAIAAWFASQPPVNLIPMMHNDMPILSAAIKARVQRAVEQNVFLPIAFAFQRAVDNGNIRSVDPFMLTGMFLSIIDGLAVSHAHVENIPPREIASRAMVSVIMNGLYAQSGVSKNDGTIYGDPVE